MNKKTTKTEFSLMENPTLSPSPNFRGGRNRGRINMSLTSSGRVNKSGFTHTEIARYCEAVAEQPTWQSGKDTCKSIFKTGFFRRFAPLNDGERNAFTLAETLIVLVILGVVASITIPPLVRRQIESANRTKIKKAMKIYDLVVNNMTTETGIRDINSLQHYAEDNDCEKGSSYFSIAEGSGCVFKTKD